MRSLNATRRRGRIVRRELLKIEGQPVNVTVKLNPRARRLIVKVHPSTGEVTVVAPSQRGLDKALEFARGEEAWIAKRLAEVPKPVVLAPGASVPLRGRDHVIRQGEDGPSPVWLDDDNVIRVSGRREHAPRRLLDFLKREAKRTLEERTFEFARRIGVQPRRISVRDTASRWGSCSVARSISFSWRLILAPVFVLDYVVAHEVAHLREMNHGPRFWRLVRELVDDPKRPQAWLRKHGVTLHRYAPRQ
jgi:predicted metal-dependent hydrolase